MHGRVHNLSRIVLSQQRYVVIFLMVLAGGLLFSSLAAEAKSDYEIINTGIKGGGCWYDDNHFIVIKGQQPAPGQEFEVEGLYSFDPSYPKTIKRIDLSPIDPSQQRHIHNVTCQDQTIVFSVRSGESRLQRIYGLKIGTQPELIAEMRAGSVNLRGRYVFSKFRRAGPIEAQGLQGTGIYKAHSDCGIKYVKAGFRTLCVDTWMESGLGLPNYRLIRYTWYETVKVKDKSDQEKWVPNPEPPLKRADGTEVKLGFFLRDLDNKLIEEIPRQQDSFQYDTIHLKVEPVGRYLYCPCWKAGDHGEKRYTGGGRICRFRLDGQNQSWEEMVSVQQSPHDPFSLQDLDVNSQGDVVMIERGHRLLAALWMYSAKSGMVDKLMQVRFPDELGGPQVSPNGQWVLVGRQGGQLVLIERKGIQP